MKYYAILMVAGVLAIVAVWSLVGVVIQATLGRSWS